jgi:hypothetical protein
LESIDEKYSTLITAQKKEFEQQQQQQQHTTSQNTSFALL